MKVAITTRSELTLKDIVSRSQVSHIPNAEEILKECLFRSQEVRYGYVDGRLVCMWGLIPPTVLSHTAWLWLVTMEIIAEHKFLLVRHSQRWMEAALKVYPEIIGDVLVDNASARRWLLWLGAEFHSPIGKRIPFTIRAKNG